MKERETALAQARESLQGAELREFLFNWKATHSEKREQENKEERDLAVKLRGLHARDELQVSSTSIYVPRHVSAYFSVSPVSLPQIAKLLGEAKAEEAAHSTDRPTGIKLEMSARAVLADTIDTLESLT